MVAVPAAPVQVRWAARQSDGWPCVHCLSQAARRFLLPAAPFFWSASRSSNPALKLVPPSMLQALVGQVTCTLSAALQHCNTLRQRPTPDLAASMAAAATAAPGLPAAASLACILHRAAEAAVGVLAGFMDSVISDLQDAREKPHDPRDMPRDDAFIHTYTYVIPSEFPFEPGLPAAYSRTCAPHGVVSALANSLGTSCAAVMHSASRPRL